jgi:ribosomal protein S18 acetylase RimI-like enzyme
MWPPGVFSRDRRTPEVWKTAPYDAPMKIERLGRGDEHLVLARPDLFDNPPTAEWAGKFLASEGHHLLVALGDDSRPIGFISGVETTHPDKGTEMFLYELSVHEDERKRGVGRALVEALAELARARGCYGMWVGTEPGNAAALATYRSAGGEAPEPGVTVNWSFGVSAPRRAWPG